MFAHVVLAFLWGAAWMEMKDRHCLAPSHGRRKHRHLSGFEAVLAADHRTGRQAAFRDSDAVPIILDEFDESSVCFFFHHGAPLVGFLAHTLFSVVILATNF